MSNDLPDWTSRVQLPPVEPIATHTADVGSAGSSGVLIAGVAGRRIELAQLFLVTAAGTTDVVRGVIQGTWTHGTIPADVPFAFGAISPEAPAFSTPVSPGAMLAGVGENVNWSMVSGTPGAGIGAVLIAALYRLV